MCGRYALTLPPDAVRAFFGYAAQPNFPPRYNIAPTQPVPIVRRDPVRGDRSFALVRWGFLPGFVKDPRVFPLLFNARAEGLAEKASFRNAFRRRRCLLPADGFYEWRAGSGHGKAKSPAQPFLIRPADGGLLAFAGLWETWAGPNGEEVDTACVITTAANGTMAALHPRMPVLIEPRDFDCWLAADERLDAAASAMLRAPHDDALIFQPIGPAVNAVANDAASVQEPLGPAAPQPVPALKPAQSAFPF